MSDDDDDAVVCDGGTTSSDPATMISLKVTPLLHTNSKPRFALGRVHEVVVEQSIQQIDLLKSIHSAFTANGVLAKEDAGQLQARIFTECGYEIESGAANY